MILVDVSQTLMRNLYIQHKRDKEINEEMVRHMVLNSLRALNTKFTEKYGEMIICCDSSNSWRKEFFPLYKVNRKKTREESEIDWMVAYSLFEKIIDEITDYLPYKVIKIDGAEADDIISVMTERFHDEDKILIVSSDKDFLQLQRLSNVDQYSSRDKNFLVIPDPEDFLIDHIISGDPGDGVPNMLSPDDTFVTDTTQTRITKKRREELKEMIARGSFLVPDIGARYHRNKTLIDLSDVPEDVRKSTIDMYENSKKKSKRILMGYFMDNGLRELTERIEEF